MLLLATVVVVHSFTRGSVLLAFPRKIREGLAWKTESTDPQVFSCLLFFEQRAHTCTCIVRTVRGTRASSKEG